MAITGNIKTFYLSSLLQLLSNDKKTGILELTDGSDIVQVFFRDGTIINAFGSSRVERLTNYLRSEGIVSREQLDKCLAVSAHTGKKIGKVLVEQGLISQDLLESLLYRQIEQTLFSLFLWEQGEFEYRDQELDLSDQIVTSFDTMQVVLEASRRVDEISQLKQRVPQDNEVLEITANSEALQKATLNTAERAILSLINGKRTVKRVIADSGYDELKAYKILFSLVTAGLVIKEKNILKRPADGMQQEIPGRKRAVAASGSQAAALVAEPVQQPESPRSAPHTTPAPPDKNVPAADLPGQTAGDLFAAPAAQHIEQTPAALFAAHETTQPQQAQQQPESRELVLELEPRTKTDDLAGGKEVPAAEVPLLSDEEAPAGQTVIKIDGQYLAGADLPDPETPQRSKLQPVGKSEVAAALRTYSADSSLDDYDTELAQARRRLVKRAIAYAAGVIIIVAAGFFLKSFMLPDEPAHVPAVDVPRVAKKKPPKKTLQEVGEPAAQAEAVPVGPAAEPDAVADVFWDRKGWVSINLPPGYTVSEQPLEDRTTILISYGTDITLSIAIMPESAAWNAEDEMYAAIVKMQESPARKVQKYTALKHAGCPGYTLHYTSERDQTQIQTALYRFVCFNKSVRLEITNLSWRTSAGRELGQRIHAAVEKSFLIYQ